MKMRIWCQLVRVFYLVYQKSAVKRNGFQVCKHQRIKLKSYFIFAPVLLLLLLCCCCFCFVFVVFLVVAVFVILNDRFAVQLLTFSVSSRTPSFIASKMSRANTLLLLDYRCNLGTTRLTWYNLDDFSCNRNADRRYRTNDGKKFLQTNTMHSSLIVVLNVNFRTSTYCCTNFKCM